MVEECDRLWDDLERGKARYVVAYDQGEPGYFVFVGLFVRLVQRARSEVVMGSSSRDELISLAHAWDRAMIENDADAIGRYMADDWVIIGPDGRVADRATFLGLVESGELSHDAMESHDLQVRVYGDTAVMISRGISGGQFRGQSFREVERVSGVFVRTGRRWRCVLTHLSRLAS